MEQGILDVVASHSFDSTEFLLDATVRHPMSTNSARNAPIIPGAAAINGEHDKHVRYPSSKGRCVTPCAIETWGRLGPSLYSFLDTLSASAQARDLAHGLPRGNYKQRWLIMLSCTINKAISRAIFDSLYYSAPSPHSPLDEATVLTQDQVSAALQTASSPYGLRMYPLARPTHTADTTTATTTTAPVSSPSHPIISPATLGMRELFAIPHPSLAPPVSSAAPPSGLGGTQPRDQHGPTAPPVSSAAPPSGPGETQPRDQHGHTERLPVSAPSPLGGTGPQSVDLHS
jgi:hypothetical protein